MDHGVQARPHLVHEPSGHAGALHLDQAIIEQRLRHVRERRAYEGGVLDVLRQPVALILPRARPGFRVGRDHVDLPPLLGREVPVVELLGGVLADPRRDDLQGAAQDEEFSHRQPGEAALGRRLELVLEPLQARLDLPGGAHAARRAREEGAPVPAATMASSRASRSSRSPPCITEASVLRAYTIAHPLPVSRRPSSCWEPSVSRRVRPLEAGQPHVSGRRRGVHGHARRCGGTMDRGRRLTAPEGQPAPSFLTPPVDSE